MKYIFSMLTVFFSDMLIKNKAEQSLELGVEKKLIGEHIKLKLFHNKGAMLNTGEKQPAKVVRLSVALCICISLLFILSLFTGKLSKFRLALALLLGGAWSNAYDRLTRGYVVDYVCFPFIGKAVAKLFGNKAGIFVSGIIFNISDFFIIGGCLVSAIFLNS